MTLKTTLTEATKTAMKAKDMERVKVLRNIQAVIKQVEIDDQKELTDKEILAILQKQIKQRQESHDIYTANGRDDLAQKEQFEMEVISIFLPEQLNEEQLTNIIKDTIAKLGATSMKDMGAVMNVVKEATAGQADPALLSGLVKKALTA